MAGVDRSWSPLLLQPGGRAPVVPCLRSPAAPHEYAWGAVVRDWQSHGGRPRRRRAPYIKTHHYPKL